MESVLSNALKWMLKLNFANTIRTNELNFSEMWNQADIKTAQKVTIRHNFQFIDLEINVGYNFIHKFIYCDFMIALKCPICFYSFISINSTELTELL